MDGRDISRWLRANEIGQDCGLKVELYAGGFQVYRDGDSLGLMPSIDELYHYMCGYRAAMMNERVDYDVDERLAMVVAAARAYREAEAAANTFAIGRTVDDIMRLGGAVDRTGRALDLVLKEEG